MPQLAPKSAISVKFFSAYVSNVLTLNYFVLKKFGRKTPDPIAGGKHPFCTLPLIKATQLLHYFVKPNNQEEALFVSAYYLNLLICSTTMISVIASLCLSLT